MCAVADRHPLRSLRCLFGIHRWLQSTAGMQWWCNRCGRSPSACRNCGGQHDPTATIVICTVRGGTDG